MAISITQNNQSRDENPSLPNTSGMNVANQVVAPGPLPGVPDVNPNENPYAAAPFKAREQVGEQVSSIALKTADYIQDVKAAQQAASVDTQRSAYETRQIKSTNDINAQARTEGWSNDQDKIQAAYKNAHDQNWADTVGTVNTSNPQVRRMAARLQMNSSDTSTRQGNQFYLSEVQSSTRTAVSTQLDNLGQQLTLESQPQPGDTPELTQAKTIAALEKYHQSIADLQTNPQYKAILPSGELQYNSTQVAQKTLAEFMLSQRLALNDPLGAASGYGTNKEANDALEAHLVDRFNMVLDNSGMTGPQAEVVRENFIHSANETRQTMETDAHRQENNTRELATKQWNIKLDELSAKMSLDAYNNVLDPGKVLKYRDQTIASIGKDSTLNIDTKRELIAKVTSSYTDMAYKVRKQQDEINQRNIQTAAGVALGQQEDINKDWQTIVKARPELQGIPLSQMPADQQRTVVGLIATTYGGKIPVPLKDSLEADVMSGDPIRLQGAATVFGLLQNTNKLAGISTLKPETQTALQMLNDHMPISQVQQYLTRVNTEKTSTPMGRDANADYRQQVTSLSKGRTYMAPGDKSYTEYKPFYVAAGVEGASAQPLPGNIQAEADIITQNILQSQPGIKIRDAQVQAAAIMQANGMGMTKLNGGTRASVTIRSAEQVAGTDSTTLEADIRHNYAAAGETIPPDAKLIVTPTTTIRMNSTGAPMTHMSVQYVDSNGQHTPTRAYYWDPQNNVAADTVGAGRAYNAIIGEYNSLVDKRARQQGLESDASSNGIGQPAHYGTTYEDEKIEPGQPSTHTFMPKMSQGSRLQDKGWFGRMGDKITGDNNKPTSITDIDVVAKKNIQGFQSDLWDEAKTSAKTKGLY